MLSMVILAAAAAEASEKEPARIDVRVGGGGVAAGETARVTVTVVPSSGIKINRYPKIKVTVGEIEGLVGGSEARSGTPSPHRSRTPSPTPTQRFAG